MRIITMSYSLFLDDVRWPPTDTNDKWLIARSGKEALYHIADRGVPSTISFDHDLGDNVPTGYDFAKDLVEMVLDGKIVLPDNFTFTVHSMNPVGAENIRALMNNLLNHLKND